MKQFWGKKIQLVNIIVLDGILYDNLINKQCLYNWNIMKNRFWCEYFLLILEKNLHNYVCYVFDDYYLR